METQNVIQRSRLLALLLSAFAFGACSDGASTTAEPVAPEEATLADLDALLEGAPEQDKLPDEAKSDLVYPTKFDLADLQSPIRSQGRRGVCSIFSTVALMEHLYIKEGSVVAPDFSEQFLQWSVKVEVGSFQHTAGSNASRNLEAIQRFGIVDELTSPYESGGWNATNDERCTGDDQPTVCYTNGDPDEAALSAHRWRLPRSRWISAKRQNIKAFMFQNKTGVVAGMQFFYQSWNHGSSKLPVSSDYTANGYVLAPNAADVEQSDAKRAGHSILLIGWDDDLEVAKVDKDGEPVLDADGAPVMEKGFFLFKNSWGAGRFGKLNPFGAGYGWLSMDYVEAYARVNSAGVPRVQLPDEDCTDGLDNDFNGDVDCDDAACGDVSACQVAPETSIEGRNGEGVAIPDNDPAGVESVITLAGEGVATKVTVSLDITHTFRGDLTVSLVAPNGRSVILHGREGGADDDVVGTYLPAGLVGASIAGDWTLKVVDSGRSDVGTLNGWTLRIDNVAGPAADVVSVDATPGLPVPDHDEAGVQSVLHVDREGELARVTLNVGIAHTYSGDLIVRLTHPDGAEVTVYEQEDANAEGLHRAFDVTAFEGKDAAGDWTLTVIDNASDDRGTLDSWGLDLTLR